MNGIGRVTMRPPRWCSCTASRGRRTRPGAASEQILVGAEPELSAWDVYSVGYDTRLAPDIRGVWAADPSIPVLATFLQTRLTQAPLKDYGALALVAHSMGGLVAQRALLDHEDLCDRVSHALLFGTPSAGLRQAGRFAFLKSIKDMAKDGEFICKLRHGWSERFAAGRPFKLWTVAGARDEFVPAESSLDPFPLEDRVVVIGDHLRIVKPENRNDMGVRAVCDGIVGAAPGGPWNSALVAVEGKQFGKAIAQLEPHADELDDAHLVQLALALDSLGQADRAVGYLDARPTLGTDARGVLAGRLKRRWRAEGRKRDADEARLYTSGLQDARAAGDHAQAYYHAVNVAFMELASRDDPSGRRRGRRRARALRQGAREPMACRVRGRGAAIPGRDRPGAGRLRALRRARALGSRDRVDLRAGLRDRGPARPQGRAGPPRRRVSGCRWPPTPSSTRHDSPVQAAHGRPAAAVRRHAVRSKRDPTGRLQIDFDDIYEQAIKPAAADGAASR